MVVYHVPAKGEWWDEGARVRGFGPRARRLIGRTPGTIRAAKRAKLAWCLEEPPGEADLQWVLRSPLLSHIRTLMLRSMVIDARGAALMAELSPPVVHLSLDRCTGAQNSALALSRKTLRSVELVFTPLELIGTLPENLESFIIKQRAPIPACWVDEIVRHPPTAVRLYGPLEATAVARLLSTPGIHTLDIYPDMDVREVVEQVDSVECRGKGLGVWTDDRAKLGAIRDQFAPLGVEVSAPVARHSFATKRGGPKAR